MSENTSTIITPATFISKSRKHFTILDVQTATGASYISCYKACQKYAEVVRTVQHKNVAGDLRGRPTFVLRRAPKA